ncbi:unnamed protein product [Mytilus edulis]|uniref:Uncharacterized protein n=1 Tax=Mytilus edulis TaxID=6550 RepID=A0A8S3VJV5_MYTED|nr:unnamed protein product [Mytilus edulis]
MSHSNKESLRFYEYLNQKIGSVEVVRARRLAFIFSDLACSDKETYQITSGSRGEGLDFKDSDFDMMYIKSLFVVYEPGKNDVKDQRLQFVMDIEDTSPCFTHLRLNSMFDTLPYFYQQMMQQHRGKNFISSELYKSQILKENSSFLPMLNDIHGPCLTNYSGIQIFSASDTFHDYRRFPNEIPRSVCENITVMKTITTKNKQRYKIYKNNLSQLLVGVNSDAVSGWLKLASFFYCHKHYLKSIDIINYTLTKFTIESTLSKITLKHTHKLKLMSLSKTITHSNVFFAQNSSVCPIELNIDVKKFSIFLHSLSFTHFIHFLCCYHLEDLESCIYCAKQLNATVSDNKKLDHTKYVGELFLFDYILLGIVLQILRVLGYGSDLLPSVLFRKAAKIDKFNVTSAAFRLHHST